MTAQVLGHESGCSASFGTGLQTNILDRKSFCFSTGRKITAVDMKRDDNIILIVQWSCAVSCVLTFIFFGLHFLLIFSFPHVKYKHYHERQMSICKLYWT